MFKFSHRTIYKTKMFFFRSPLITCLSYPSDMSINFGRDSRSHSHFQTDDTFASFSNFPLFLAAAKFRWRDVERWRW